MTAKLLPGVRALDTMFRASPGFSIARMSAEQLAKVQATVIPDTGPAALVLGRLQKGVGVRTTSYAAPHGEVPLRIYTPESWSRTPRPLVVNFHGGGFALGSARQCDWSCSVVAKDLDAVVVSVDYRLAPTHRFPAAVEDSYGGLVWAVEHAAELGGDPGRVGVMGDSAGGNLAAVVAIAARDDGGPAIGHQALIYPAVDFTEQIRDTASYQANTRGIVLSNADLDVFYQHYVTEDVDPFDWRLSPLHAPDLSGLPPAVVVVAGLDPLHDIGVQYAQALADAGNDVTVEDFHVMPHGFVSFPYFSKGARPAMHAIVASQRAALL
ncbi:MULTISPECIES: alpha/beta hydrolase [unclassified Nocardioides]|uniref:alpha/beta hydrolase n=1 Tax=unclassified Nocardioides TaxID=2615069 RepID=UPI0009F0BBE4|nr:MULTISPECIES: alpha/beta hydrolase [unclassified Nocardioides]GAW50958.1 Alpha/beta hydrolase fold-3 domain protein [Nocardioides sp. PD653-B2]GAW56315.1 Alpha/beta hydrolase fold-3 domain protein [Nocardioides sp. PD653]